jgi:cyclophilin family peptidyl-prolyl cis-trans isomerase
VSKAKPSAPRPAANITDDGPAFPESWRRSPWIPVLIVGIVLVAVLGAGLAVDQALKTPRPTALSECRTSTQIAKYQFIGPQPICITAAHTYQAMINTTQGHIVIQLYPQIAPVTVNNFIVLALNGYYDGMAWTTSSWVVQNGDPTGDGRGGPGYTLPDEPNTAPSWGVGAVGMARPAGAPINGSQFFIQRSQWPGKGPTFVYNRFGTVIAGIDQVGRLTAPSDRINSITIQVGPAGGL